MRKRRQRAYEERAHDAPPIRVVCVEEGNQGVDDVAHDGHTSSDRVLLVFIEVPLLDIPQGHGEELYPKNKNKMGVSGPSKVGRERRISRCQ